MPTASILKAESPSCIWGRVFCDPDSDAEMTKQYHSLTTQMNLFYHDVTRDLSKLQPVKLEQGLVCVVYCSEMKSWCRALVETVIIGSESCRAHCFLVDYGEHVLVSSDQIQVIVQNFLQLPFWVRKFHLARIKPTTLQVSLCEERAKLIPTTKWDSSACLYLHNLLQVSTQTEAVLLESSSDTTAIMLYVTVRSIKICVNDDMVTKKFAHYDSQSADGNWLDEVEQTPLMLSHSVLTQMACKTVKRMTGDTQLPPGLFAIGESDSPSASVTPQSQNCELETSEEGSTSPDSQSGRSFDFASALSDSSEKTGSFLPAALTENHDLHRFPTSENHGGSYQQDAASVISNEDSEPCQPEETTAAFSTGQEVIVPTSSGEAGTRQAEKTRRPEEDLLCSRLLEQLNPTPLNLNESTEDPVVVPSDPGSRGILMHSALPVEACSSLDDAPLLDTLCSVCRRKQYNSPSPADCYSWPSIARGCNTVVVSHNADRPLSYLLPLLTHMLLSSINISHTSRAGPIAVLLCPSWQKVQLVYDLLEETKVAAALHPTIVLLGTGKDEAKAFRIPKNCLLLVTTPFSFVRLLSCRCFLFLRLYHLVLDEADQLFTLAAEQMVTILQHFQKVTTSEEKTYCPQQLVAVAKRWNSHMDRLLANHMPYPCIVVTVPEEVALYGNVQQIILMALESSKISVLLGALDLNPNVGQKTVIITNSAQEVEDVFQAVRSKAVFCLMTHEGLTHQFDSVIQQWRKDVGPGIHVFLVTSSACLKCLGIRDATCVIHYDFPTSPKVFGSRLFCMADNFRDLSKRVPVQVEADSSPPPSRSVLLISEKNARYGIGILRFMMRADARMPPELLAFVQGIRVAREDHKTEQPLCGYLKSFGVCRDSAVCPDRHSFISQVDQSELPASGLIEVVPLRVKTASVFCGRIVRKDDTAFQNMAAEMAVYYGDKKPVAKELLEGHLYAVQVDKEIHRVKILSVPERGERLYFSVLVRFIDVGHEKEVKSYQILLLPEQFHSLPGQAVEIIICRVKPADNESEWHPKVTRAISQKICGVPHQARAVFSLGSTVFVDPMVRVSQVPGMKTVINEYNVQSLILNTGMGTTNPKHLDLLTALCQKAGHVSGLEEGQPVLELRIQAEEEVLTEALRAAKVAQLAEPTKTPGPGSSLISAIPELEAATVEPLRVPGCGEESLASLQAADDQKDCGAADLKSAQQNMRDDAEVGPSIGWTAALDPCKDGVDQNNNQHVSTHAASAKSFHPQIRWYQTRDIVIATVKLKNPNNQHCDFYQDKVVYSGRVDDRTYRAELDLQGSIAAELCSWEMKSNEPVLKLVKQEQGYWERLIRIKNIFVSYDMEHFEEEEDTTPNGLRFVGNTGEENWYVESESGSESD